MLVVGPILWGLVPQLTFTDTRTTPFCKGSWNQVKIRPCRTNPDPTPGLGPAQDHVKSRDHHNYHSLVILSIPVPKYIIDSMT